MSALQTKNHEDVNMYVPGTSKVLRPAGEQVRQGGQDGMQQSSTHLSPSIHP